jgi:hypothetical protein
MRRSDIMVGWWKSKFTSEVTNTEWSFFSIFAWDNWAIGLIKHTPAAKSADGKD